MFMCASVQDTQFLLLNQSLPNFFSCICPLSKRHLKMIIFPFFIFGRKVHFVFFTHISQFNPRNGCQKVRIFQLILILSYSRIHFFFSNRKRGKQSLTDPWIFILPCLPKLFNGFPCLSSMKTYFRINAAEHKSCIKPLYEGTKGEKKKNYKNDENQKVYFFFKR